jgi:hypothetical protein
VAARRESGLSKMLGSMTRLFSKNFARSTDLLFLKSLAGSNGALKKDKEDEVRKKEKYAEKRK